MSTVGHTAIIGPGDAILTAVTVPSQFYLGSALVDTKTNEIEIKANSDAKFLVMEIPMEQ